MIILLIFKTEGYYLTEDENFEQTHAGLKSSYQVGIIQGFKGGRDCSNKRESAYLFCLQSESIIFDISENKCVPEIGAPLYKVSRSKLF